ncbi:hypothetical protein DL96DRAFT_1689341 [Flagelloscypha sp. PMI_526]|nr:hypothetical protein DL96DRAFT_1689341 [Flagelloscypha sp. PMI_526]
MKFTIPVILGSLLVASATPVGNIPGLAERQILGNAPSLPGPKPGDGRPGLPGLPGFPVPGPNTIPLPIPPPRPTNERRSMVKARLTVDTQDKPSDNVRISTRQDLPPIPLPPPPHQQPPIEQEEGGGGIFGIFKKIFGRRQENPSISTDPSLPPQLTPGPPQPQTEGEDDGGGIFGIFKKIFGRQDVPGDFSSPATSPAQPLAPLPVEVLDGGLVGFIKKLFG